MGIMRELNEIAESLLDRELIVFLDPLQSLDIGL
jgi:hypothetical protein